MAQPIVKRVFRDTRSLFIQYLEGTLTEYVNDTAESVCDYAFYGRNNLTSVETSAEEIGINAFYDCTKLTTVNLVGSGAVSVGSGAFANCVKLDAVIIRADSVGTMATGTGVFSQTKIRNGYGAIYVEDSLVSSYKAATNWGAYNICLISAYPVTDFSTISDTWAQIFAAELDGTCSTKYVVGDTKKFILGDSEEVYMQIAAMDVDVLADNNGTAKITWISKSLLKDGHRMNPARVAKTSGIGTLGGWEACEMRTYLRETVFPNIPQEIRSAIKTVKKYSCIYTTDGVKQVDVLSEDSVWIPSYREMCGGTDYESSTPVYSSTASARIRSKIGGSNSYWWLRSANSAYNFSYVDESGGTKATYTPTNSLGVVLGFCT